MTPPGVKKITDEFLTSVLENQSLKAAAAHTTDFEVPLYNVWKQQEKTRGSVARSCGNVAGPFAFSVRKYFGNISEVFPSGVGLTERLKEALEDSVADPDRLHQRLFFALCRDLTDFAALANSVEATTILDLVSDYATGELEAQRPDPFLK